MNLNKKYQTEAALLPEDLKTKRQNEIINKAKDIIARNSFKKGTDEMKQLMEEWKQAGRVNKEDSIDPSVGIILNKKVGDEVIEGDFLAYVCANNEEKLKEAERRILEIYKID